MDEGAPAAPWFTVNDFAKKLAHPFIPPGGPPAVVGAAASKRQRLGEFHQQAVDVLAALTAEVQQGLAEQEAATDQSLSLDSVSAADLAVPWAAAVPSMTATATATAATTAASTAAADTPNVDAAPSFMRSRVPQAATLLHSWKEGVSAGAVAVKAATAAEAAARVVPSHLHGPDTASVDPNDVLQPGDDIVITVVVFEAGAEQAKVIMQELQVLGSNTLVQLRDAIRCPLDSLAQGLDVTNPAGYFFIDNTFYDDTRQVSRTECSALLQQWAEAAGVIRPRALVHACMADDEEEEEDVVGQQQQQQMQMRVQQQQTAQELHMQQPQHMQLQVQQQQMQLQQQEGGHQLQMQEYGQQQGQLQQQNHLQLQQQQQFGEVQQPQDVQQVQCMTAQDTEQQQPRYALNNNHQQPPPADQMQPQADQAQQTFTAEGVADQQQQQDHVPDHASQLPGQQQQQQQNGSAGVDLQLHQQHQHRVMQDTLLSDLYLQVSNRPLCLYSHQGFCEHQVMISDVRLLHNTDPLCRTAYPRTTYKVPIGKRFRCNVCRARKGVATLLIDHPEAPELVSMLCGRCAALFDVAAYPTSKKIVLQ